MATFSQKHDRQPYRIKRGSLSRREGDPVVIKDDKGNALKKGREFVHYSAGGRNEVMLTEEEALAFGLHKLDKLSKSEIKSRAELPAQAPVDDNPEPSDDGEVSALDRLILEGEEVKGLKPTRAWRKRVIDADLLEEVPSKKDDIMDALRALKDEE